MTREELNRKRLMFQIQQNRNQLLKPDLGMSHSATNEFLNYRKRVAAGMRAKKESEVNYFNITEANSANYQEMLNSNAIIHAGTPSITNDYIAKIEYLPGKYRYFYTQAEYDSYLRNKQGATNAGADRAAREQPKKPVVGGSQSGRSQEAAAQGKAQDEYKNLKKLEDRANEIQKDSARWDKYNKALNEDSKAKLSKWLADRNLKTYKDAAKYPGGPDKAYDDLEDYMKEILQQQTKESGKASAEGSAKAEESRWAKVKSDKEKEVQNEKEYKKNEDYAKNAGADKGAKESEEAEKQKAEKEQYKSEKARKKEIAKNKGWSDNKKAKEEKKQNLIDNTDAEVAKVNEYFSKNKNPELKAQWDKEYDALVKDIKNGKLTNQGDITKRLNEIYGDISLNMKLQNQSSGFSGNKMGFNPIYSKNHSVDEPTGNNAFSKALKTATSSAIKKQLGFNHDAFDDESVTTSAMTPEQEYLAFRAKVEQGMKHFGIMRSTISVPINTKLRDEWNSDELAHATNYKYYNKIKLPDGTARYFYSKEEWDAYNNDTKKNNKDISDVREWTRKTVLNSPDGRAFTQVEIKQDEARNKSLANKDASDQVVKEGFITKTNNIVTKTGKNAIRSVFGEAKYIPEGASHILKKEYQNRYDKFKEKYKDREDATKYDLPEKYPFKNEFKSRDSIEEPLIRNVEGKLFDYYVNGNKEGAEGFLDKHFDSLESQWDEELAKREKSIEAYDKFYNNLVKRFETIEDDVDSLSKYEKQILADELGISDWNDADILKKYGIPTKLADIEPGDDYGASKFEEYNKAVEAFWNDYKEAKKALGSKVKDED